MSVRGEQCCGETGERGDVRLEMQRTAIEPRKNDDGQRGPRGWIETKLPVGL